MPNAFQPTIVIKEDLVKRKFSQLRGPKIVNDPVKELSNEISRSERFIKMIKLEPQLDERGLENILENYRDLKKIILR